MSNCEPFKELGIETSSEADELRTKLNEKQLPVEALQKLRKEIDRLERTPSQSAELTVMRSYIDWILALPWNEHSEDTFDIEKARQIWMKITMGLKASKNAF